MDLEKLVNQTVIHTSFGKGIIRSVDKKYLEVDFVAMDQKRTIYYQVAASVRDENTLRRELTPLQKIPDHYQKVILTLDEDPEADYDGIRRINALDWLVGLTD